LNKKRGTFSKQKKKAIHEGKEYPRIRDFSKLEAKPLLKEIQNRSKNDPVRTALINYLIIRTVTVFETFLLTEAYKLSKKKKDKTKKLFTDVKVDIPLSEQVISTFSFTNLENVHEVFSTLLDIDFLKEIQEESIRYEDNYFYEDAHIKRTKPLHKNWNAVCSIFELRHDIVHHNKLVKLGYSEIRNLVGGIIQFLLCAIMIVF